MSRPAETGDRAIRFRVGLAWGLLFLNVLTFYKGTWNQLPLIVPIPSKIGQLMTQGSLPAALLVAWSANRRMLFRPNVFLTPLTLLFVEALLSAINPNGHIIGTLYRTCRLGEFIATLWLLSPFADRRDLLFVKCQLKALGVRWPPCCPACSSRRAGHWPGQALRRVLADHPGAGGGPVGGRPRPDRRALVLRRASGRRTLPIAGVLSIMLLLTHTRTEVIALMAGLFVAGLSMFTVRIRVRRLFASAAITVSVAAIAFSSVLTAWLARGESSEELSNLTGRTNVWTTVVNSPRDLFQMILGYGLSNKASNGLPIDSNWLAGYYDLGLLGVAIIASFLLFVLVNAFFQPPGTPGPCPVPGLLPHCHVVHGDRPQRRLDVPARASLAAMLLSPPPPRKEAWYAGAAGP